VRIWPERGDGVWLYQEQAILSRDGMTPAQAKARPYFQRVGHVYRTSDGRIRRDNYAIRDAARFVGKPSAITLADLGPAGCHNILERAAAGHWTGRTEDCRNGYKGAVTMKSLAVYTANTYANWDRGFAADGRQVWGPAEGGYIFERK
jgi:hypothetical protein